MPGKTGITPTEIEECACIPFPDDAGKVVTCEVLVLLDIIP